VELEASAVILQLRKLVKLILCQTAREHPVCILILHVRHLAVVLIFISTVALVAGNSAVVLHNVNATSVQAWRKCKMSTNGAA